MYWDKYIITDLFSDFSKLVDVSATDELWDTGISLNDPKLSNSGQVRNGWGRLFKISSKEFDN